MEYFQFYIRYKIYYVYFKWLVITVVQNIKMFRLKLFCTQLILVQNVRKMNYNIILHNLYLYYILLE